MPSLIALNFSELSIAILADRQVSRGYLSFALMMKDVWHECPWEGGMAPMNGRLTAHQGLG